MKIELHYKANNKETVKRVSEALQQFGDKLVTITIEKLQRKRSTKQNRAYWGILVPLVRAGLKDIGFNLILEETHEFLKDKFARKEIVNEDGEVLGYTSSTTKLTTVEFMEYYAEIQQWAAEYLGIFIPDPETEEK